jgi:hypothetical protein
LNTIYQHGSCTFEDRAVLMPLVTLCGTLKWRGLMCFQKVLNFSPME